MLKILSVKSLMTELVSDIHTYENVKTKGYEHEFDYYDEKQFKQLNKLIEKKNEGKEEEKQEHITIVGNINLKKPVKLEDYDEFKDDEEKEVTLLKVNILDFENPEYEQFDTYFEVYPPDDKTECFGYLRVGKFEYIRIEDGMAAVIVTKGKLGRWTKRGIKFVVLSFIVTAIFFGAKRGYEDLSKTYDIQKIIDKYIHGKDFSEKDNSGEQIDSNLGDFTDLEVRQEQQVEMEYIEVAGYANLLVYDEYQTIDLINMKNNTVFQKYTILLDDEIVFETGLIPPGKVVDWNAYETLPAGKHTVIFNISTYDYVVDENGNATPGGACNGASQKVEIECRK